MAKSTLQVQLANRNIILKQETVSQLRSIARAILELKSEKLVKELGNGMIVNGEKLIKVTITSAESDQSGVEVL